MKQWCIALVTSALLSSCSATQTTLPHTFSAAPQQSNPLAIVSLNANVPSPIRHVIIIDQENRTPDNLFQGLRGADISDSGLNAQGQTVKLHAESLAWSRDLAHTHGAFKIDYDAGKLDGWSRAPSTCSRNDAPTCPYGYVPSNENQPYIAMAQSYVFGDRMFQSNQGPSYPSHQYIISGDSRALPQSNDPVSENPEDGSSHKTGGGCDAPAAEKVETIEPTGLEQGLVRPCFDRPVLSDLVDRKGGLTWRYYQDGMGQGLWKAFDSIRHVRYGKDYANVISPPENILSDIAHNRLANVVWVTPPGDASDHSGKGSAKGPAWVAAVVNAVGQSSYWNSTAIIVTWDDWGGWFDHVKPPVRNSYELGFRVPLVVISPYAKANYVSHVQYEFGSLLKFTEATFGLGSLNTTDAIANDLTDCFDLGQKPRRFAKIPAPPYHQNFSRVQSPDDE